jgi:hypothetical protein
MHTSSAEPVSTSSPAVTDWTFSHWLEVVDKTTEGLYAPESPLAATRRRENVKDALQSLIYQLSLLGRQLVLLGVSGEELTELLKKQMRLEYEDRWNSSV